MQDSPLNQIIAPEISNDAFHQYIVRLCGDPSVKNVLEIGSSAGQGSTSAFVTGLSAKQGDKKLFCIEVSKVRFKALKDYYKDKEFVNCYNCSSVPLNSFPTPEEIINFYNELQTGLNKYPLKDVLRWLYEDIEYVRNERVLPNGIEQIKIENNIDFFDLVLIDGSEFTGKPELDEVYGAKHILLDDINTFKNYENHISLLNDDNYQLMFEDRGVRNGFSIFSRVGDKPEVNPDLPVHFLTIVLNGNPFIQYHLNILKELPFKWHWHIVEGVAELKHDTAWSLSNGGRVDESIHANGLSIDGTTAFLDNLAYEYPENVSLYRQPSGQFWDGKLEMVNAPLAAIQEECLLWQIDVDEFWTVEQLIKGRQLFINYPHKTAAYYWCHYFVGPDLVITSRNCYSQNPIQEWLRTWRYKPGMFWTAHEPPTLSQISSDGTQRNVATLNPFTHDRMEREGLVFQHYAYVLPQQLQFKEKYYGYAGALKAWQELNNKDIFPIYLKNYFDWVKDDTTVGSARANNIFPIAEIDEIDFYRLERKVSNVEVLDSVEDLKPKILVDAVFFQLLDSGIGRVWKSLLEEWSTQDFSRHLLVLDREGTAPKIDGIRYRKIHAYLKDYPAMDSFLLQRICDEESADIFISTYYTTPISTSSTLLVYDLIPEVLNSNLDAWRERIYSIFHASQYISISKNTAKDLARFYPEVLTNTSVEVSYCGVSSDFQPVSRDSIKNFREKHGIFQPFFCMVGSRQGFNDYKNGKLFFEAFSKLRNKSEFSIICTGGGDSLEPEFQALTKNINVLLVTVSDEELAAIYSDAIALVYPSKYEGFGMPIAEAMACGCPVITCNNSSIPEVAGTAALYVGESDVDAMVSALERVQIREVRQALIEEGKQQAQTFSWSAMAEKVMTTVLDSIARNSETNDLVSGRISWLWKQLRLAELREFDIKSATDVEIFLLTQGCKIEKRQKLDEVLSEIKAIENSKIWKLRNKAFQVKSIMGGKGAPKTPDIDFLAPIDIQLSQAVSKLEWMKNSSFVKSLKRIKG
jgi:glycosyltransferase involved in cell wall biosynthesis